MTGRGGFRALFTVVIAAGAGAGAAAAATVAATAVAATAARLLIGIDETNVVASASSLGTRASRDAGVGRTSRGGGGCGGRGLNERDACRLGGMGIHAGQDGGNVVALGCFGGVGLGGGDVVIDDGGGHTGRFGWGSSYFAAGGCLVCSSV